MGDMPDNSQDQVTLSPADAAAVDAILDPASSGTPTDPARTERAKAWLSVLAGAPVPAPSADLVNRTLAAVQSERMKVTPETLEDQKSKIENQESPWYRRRRVADIAAGLVAASIFVAILIPIISHANYSNRRTACTGNLATVASAMETYASLEGQQLPALAVSDDGNWLNPPAAGHTNTANLLPLVLASVNTPGYLPLTKLVCPGREKAPAAATIKANDIADCGYSYTNLFGEVRQTWDGKNSTIILADTNPLFGVDRVRNPDFNSVNHRRNGNNVLRADRTVTWETSPNIGPKVGTSRDNIWTITVNSQRVTNYKGDEKVAHITDAFLAP